MIVIDITTHIIIIKMQSVLDANTLFSVGAGQDRTTVLLYACDGVYVDINNFTKNSSNLLK